MRFGDVLYRRSDGADIIYVDYDGGVMYASVVIGDHQYEALPLISLTARGDWEPTELMLPLLGEE